jgi:hypothetical protein
LEAVLMANRPQIDESKVVGSLLAPVLLAGVAVLIQIRDGKDARSIESAIDEARQIVHLAVPKEEQSAPKKA